MHSAWKTKITPEALNENIILPNNDKMTLILFHTLLKTGKKGKFTKYINAK